MNNWSQYEYLSLASQKRDGSWVETPVWFAGQGDVLYVFSESKAGKVKRIRNYSDIKISPCTVTGKKLSSADMATAEILVNPVDIEQAKSSLKSSYGWKMSILNMLSTFAGKINKRSFIKITLQ